MRFRTIPRHDWYAFLGEFSQRHQGALVSIKVKGPLVTPGPEVIDQPFRGLSEDGHGTIFVHIGDGPDHPHLGHRVAQVDSLLLEQTDEGADAAVEIRSGAGDVALLQFRSPIITEILDPATE